MGYVRLNIHDRTTETTLPLRCNTILELPDGGLLFRAEFCNDVDVILSCDKAVKVGPDRYTQKLYLFDKELTFEHPGFLSVLFSVVTSGKGYSRIIVDISKFTSVVTIGSLAILSGGPVVFNDEEISSDGARRKWAKALMLNK